LGGGLFELRGGVGIAGPVGQVGVAVDESGQHRHFREIDGDCAGRRGDVFTERFDFAVADQDQLIRQNAASVDVDELSGADDSDRGRWMRFLREAADSGQEREQQRTEVLPEHGCPFRRQSLQHLAKDVLQNAAVVVVGNFFGSVDARDGGELFFLAVAGLRSHRDRFAGSQRGNAFDGEYLVTR
jgi:hypothetical protein